MLNVDMSLPLEQIMKKAEQFPKDEISNDNERMVKSWGSVEVKDVQGDIVPMAEFKRNMDTYMDLGAPIMDAHSNRQTGKALNWGLGKNPKTGKDGMWLAYKIFNKYKLHDMVWNDIKSGKRKGLSIGAGKFGKSKKTKDDYSGEEANQLSGMEIYEFSSVTNPANEFAENFAINYMAKSANGSDAPKGWKNNVVNRLKSIEGVNNPEALSDWLWYHQINKSVEKKVEERNGKWVVTHCSGPDAGKVIATHDSKEEAESHHRAIQANKALEWDDKEMTDNIEKAINTVKEAVYKVDVSPPTTNEKPVDESLNTGEDKNKSVKNMAETKKQEEEKKPEENEEKSAVKQNEEEESKPQLTVEDVNEKVEKLASAVTKLTETLSKTKQEEEKPEEMEEPKDEEKKKEQEKLPKSETGEADETAKPETDEVPIMEKVKEAVTKSIEKGFENVMKSQGFNVTKSERNVTTEPGKTEPTASPMDTITKEVDDMQRAVLNGEMPRGEFHQKVNKMFVNKSRDAMKEAMEKEPSILGGEKS